MLYAPDSLHLAKGEPELPHILHNLSSSAHLGQPGLPESFVDSKSLGIRAVATSDHILPPSADWGRFPRDSNVDLQVHTTPALQLYSCVLRLWWDDRVLPRLTSILPAHLNPVNDWIRAFSQHRQVRVRASCDITSGCIPISSRRRARRRGGCRSRSSHRQPLFMQGSRSHEPRLAHVRESWK